MFMTRVKSAFWGVLLAGILAAGSMLLPNRTPAVAGMIVDPPESKIAAPVPKQDKEKELTAWGKEIGGLQAGLGYRPREKRVYRSGETITLVARIRNVGKEEVSFQHLRHFFIENPPTITDDKGKAVAFKDGSPGVSTSRWMRPSPRGRRSTSMNSA